MKIPYNKPWLSFGDQLTKLKSRGLVVSDDKAACDFLSHLNYYRFIGYSLAFEEKEFFKEWRTRVETLIDHQTPAVPDALARMGMPDQWKKHPQWNCI